MRFDESYWTQKYINQNTGWDIGYPSTPIKEYIDQLQNKELRILVPGAGNGYEVAYLFKEGFTNVFMLDISNMPLDNFKITHPDFPSKQLIQEDFFKHQGKYDIIFEQTFFCALDPINRKKYVEKMHELLNPAGMLVGLLFDFPLSTKGPPFGGSENEYRKLFEAQFKIEILARAYNSIKPRQGSELFIKFRK